MCRPAQNTLGKTRQKTFRKRELPSFHHKTVYRAMEDKIRNFAPDTSACPNVLPRTKQMLLHELM